MATPLSITWIATCTRARERVPSPNPRGRSFAIPLYYTSFHTPFAAVQFFNDSSITAIRTLTKEGDDLRRGYRITFESAHQGHT